ncbi:chemotaxis protein CheW [Pontibacterium sp.]|uniref:chemotaxis protein CheW n=1 Tax=Pontibacterium sp. TaxID=2036026 RepID=UPI00356247A2
MTKLPEDADYYAPQTGNQQVVFDYLESLLEDPDTLARDTEAELQAIEALERDEPQESEPSLLTVESELLDAAPTEPNASEVEIAADTSATSDEPEPELFPAEDDTGLAVELNEAVSLDTPAELIGEDSLEDHAQPELDSPPVQAVETHVDDAAPKPALDIPEDVLNCILFQLQGLNLAIPVDDVDGAVSMERLTLHLDLDHEWVLGAFTAMDKETRVVDTGSWLLPGRFDPARAKYEEVLILKGRRWALACDTLVKSIRMSHSDIVWAGDSNTRPWMLGTNMNERCAIMDVDKLQALLDENL